MGAFQVKCGAQEIASGLEIIGRLVESGSGMAGLTVHPRCAGLIAALEGYRWGDSRAKPRKDGVFDHPMDALRYALWGAEGRGWKVERRSY